MPARVPVPKALQVVLKQVLSEDVDCINRLYFQYTGSAPTDAQLEVMGAAVVGAWTADVAPLLSTQNTLIEVEITDWSSVSSAVGITTASVAGGHAEVGLSAG